MDRNLSFAETMRMTKFLSEQMWLSEMITEESYGDSKPCSIVQPE